MHIVERYSLALGAKIDKPIINRTFFPTPEKYIVIGCMGAMPGKTYPYFQEVINIILPNLKENGIEIVQLGGKEEPGFQGARRLNGETSFSQAAYIIENALAVVSVDTAFIHMASAVETPIVGIYSISPPESCGPYWGNKNKQILLEPEFSENENYSYNPNAVPLPAEGIKPELIVEAISKILGIKFPEIKTKYIGNSFLASFIQIVPDSSLLPPDQFPGMIPTIKLDWGGTEQIAFAQIQTRRCALYINKPIERFDILLHLKGNIDRVIYEVDQECDTEFAIKLMKSGIPTILVTEKSNEEMGETRLKLSEHSIIFAKPVGKRPDGIEIGEKTRAKSSKIIFAQNHSFASYYNFKNNIPISDGSNLFIPVDDPKLWEDEFFLMIYDKLS